MNKKLLPIVFGSVLLGGALVIAAWPGQAPGETIKSKTQLVQVGHVTAQDQQRVIRFSGVARASDRARLAFSLPGRLATRAVNLGDSVVKRQVIARLDGKPFQNALAAAESAREELEVRLAQAERDFLRVTRLAKAKAATTEEVEKTATATRALRAAVASATIRMEEAQRVESESRLLAPFSGTVTAVHLEPGEWANPGMPVVEIAGASALEVEVQVPETVATHLLYDREVLVQLPMSGIETVGHVARGAQAALGPGALFPVVIHLESHSKLVPGSTVEVLLPVAHEGSLTLPLEAVLNPGSSMPSVFRVRQGLAEQIPVDLGHLNGDRISVAADLAIGDEVVIAGHTALAHGMPVEVRR